MRANSAGFAAWAGVLFSGLTFMFGAGILRQFATESSAEPTAVLATQQTRSQVTSPEPTSPVITQAKPASTNPTSPQVNVQEDHLRIPLQEVVEACFALQGKDHHYYLLSLNGKKVTWTGHMSKLFLTDNFLYLSHLPDKTPMVCVMFSKSQVPIAGSLKPNDRIQVTGTTEVRGDWIVLHDSELSRCP